MNLYRQINDKKPSILLSEDLAIKFAGSGIYVLQFCKEVLIDYKPFIRHHPDYVMNLLMLWMTSKGLEHNEFYQAEYQADTKELLEPKPISINNKEALSSFLNRYKDYYNN